MSLENPRAKPCRKRNSSSQIPKSEAVATCPIFPADTAIRLFRGLDVRAGPEDAVFLGRGLHDLPNSEPPAGALFHPSFRLPSLFIPADI